jgi:hypothetical protein
MLMLRVWSGSRAMAAAGRGMDAVTLTLLQSSKF